MRARLEVHQHRPFGDRNQSPLMKTGSLLVALLAPPVVANAVNAVNASGVKAAWCFLGMEHSAVCLVCSGAQVKTESGPTK